MCIKLYMWQRKKTFVKKVLNILKKVCIINNHVLYLHQVYNWLVKGLHPPRLEAFFFFTVPILFY